MSAKTEFVKLAELVEFTCRQYQAVRSGLRTYGPAYVNKVMRMTGLGVRGLARATGYSPTMICGVRLGRLVMPCRLMVKLGDVVKRATGDRA